MRRVFPAYGVRFIAINDNVDTENDAADDLTVSVKNIMNEAYCRDISVKTRSALEAETAQRRFCRSLYGLRLYKSPVISIRAWKLTNMPPMWCGIFSESVWRGSALPHIADELNWMGVLSPLAYKRNNGMPHAKKAAIRIARTVNGPLLLLSVSCRMKPIPERWFRAKADHASLQTERDVRISLPLNGSG